MAMSVHFSCYLPLCCESLLSTLFEFFFFFVGFVQISIDGLQLDGTLWIRACEGAKVAIKDLEIRNQAYWEFRDATPEVLAEMRTRRRKQLKQEKEEAKQEAKQEV